MKKLLVAIAAVLGVLILAGGAALDRMNAFTRVDGELPWACEAISLPGSAEDIVIDRLRGVAYLSVLDRRSLGGNRSVRGVIFALDLNTDPIGLSLPLAEVPAHLHPHGMSLHQDEAGNTRLFVINHPRDRDGGAPEAVEIYERRDDGLLHHLRSVSSGLLNSPNDLQAIGPEQFVAVNDTGAANGFERALEFLFGAGWATAVHYDGRSVEVAAEGLAGGAGIAYADGRFVIAETQGKRLRFMTMEPGGRLSESARVAMPGFPDNIDADASGMLWVAEHPNGVALGRHFGDADYPAPSRFYRIAPDGTDLELIAADSGRRHSAGSVAARHQDKLLLGSITEPRVLVCQLPKGESP
ncbi:MAG: hypothetical protein OXE48_09625 [Gammaproteobacteria bacterium]|nr:hypothetical protein [Gammaproteobacteria bacterium]